MDWLQVFTIAATTFGCCLYFRRETKVQLDKMEEHGRERDQEIKDFHGRLCVIEEKHLQLVRDQADKFQQLMREQSEIRTVIIQRFLEK
jgi:hypothetical protein